ncbi:hypothetical protein N9L06_04665, partial [Mariniblastus sp.]|nr:hypothetical protein [Mariniblastus sp.]
MLIRKLSLNLTCLVASLAVLAIPGLTNAQIVFNFDEDTEFDNGAGVNATMTAMSADEISVATVTIVDLFTQEFVDDGSGTFVPTSNVLTALGEDGVVTQIDGSLGIDNPSVSDDDFFPTDGDGAGVENRDINDGEGLVIRFDVPVVFTEIDFASLDDGTVNVTIEGVGSFDLVEDNENAPGDAFSNPF